MAFHIPQTILKALKAQYLANPTTLTEGETTLIQRLETCTICHWYWVRRGRKIPRRCPKCNSTAWNRPFLNALMGKRKKSEEPPEVSQ